MGDGRSRLLIVNADDYGLTERISRGILRAHVDGIVTSTSVLMLGPAVQMCAPWLDDAPGLRVGAHLAAVGEDPPLLQAREVPTLVDQRGRLPVSWRGFVRRALVGRIDADDLRREFAAQIEALADTGRNSSHLDTHQHLHLWPVVGRVLVELAGEFHVGAVRVPRSRRAGPTGSALRALGCMCARRARVAGLAFPGDAAGLDEAGRLGDGAIVAALAMLSDSKADAVELIVHPGEAHDPERDRYAWGFSWEEELEALTGPAVRDAVAASGFTLGGYDGLGAEIDAA